VRVILAEDVGLYRDLLRQTLTAAGIEVIGEAGQLDEAVALADADPPDAALLDIRMPPSFTDEGLRAALRIRARHPSVAVLLLSSYGEVEYAVQLVDELTNGVGYLLKERTASAADLVDALRRVAAGGVVIDPDVVTRLIRTPRLDNPLTRLTDRELETLGLIAEGLSNAAVAGRLRIQLSTVEKHVGAVFRKLVLGPEPGRDDNARVRAVLAYLRHTGRLPG
jgi:DNA-binding NarL/FixJ family response regulator